MTSPSSSTPGVFVVQRFIKCKGPNAFVTRAVWKANKPPQAWVITNKTSYFDPDPNQTENDKYITNIKKKLGSSIVHSNGGYVAEQTCSIVHKIVKFLQKSTGVFFDEMVCDFIKDESGIWWFIGCRGFNISGTAPRWSFKFFLPEALLI